MSEQVSVAISGTIDRQWECPDCGKLGGKHAKACGYE